jgi:hypothetical protein
MGAAAQIEPGDTFDPSTVLRDLGGDRWRLRCACGAVFVRHGERLRRNVKIDRATTCDACIAKRFGGRHRKGEPRPEVEPLTDAERAFIDRFTRDDDGPQESRPRRIIDRPPEVEDAIAAGAITREQAQGRSVRGVRNRVFTVKMLSKVRRLPVVEVDVERPRSRAECEHMERPCPWVGCRWHTFLDVNPSTGTITLNFPDVDPGNLDRLPYTCALDVAEHGGAMLEDVGAVLNLTRERVRQIEAGALARIRGRMARLDR